MKKTILPVVLVLLVCVAVLVIPGTALADTYTFEGLGGAGTPLSIASNGTSLFVGMDDGTVWRNTSGTIWTQVGNLGGTVNAMVYDGATIYAGTSNGEVFYYISDGTWGWAGYGAGYGNSVTCLVASGTPGFMYAGSSNRHVYWKNGASSWLDTVTDMGSTVFSLTKSSSYVYASTQVGIVYRYNNNPSAPAWTNLGYCGTSDAHVAWNDGIGLYALGYNSHAWQYTGVAWADTGTVGFFSITSFISVGTMYYAGNTQGQVWAYNGSWNNTGAGFSPSARIQAMAGSGTDVFAASANGHVGAYSGGSWTDLWPTAKAQVNDLLGTGSSLWAGCENGQVYFYAGAWTPDGNNIGSPVLCLGMSDTALYAGCANGNVYYNNAGTWTSTAGPGSPPNSLAFDGFELFAGCPDGHIYAYDQGGGTWYDAVDAASGSVNDLAWTGADMYAATQDGEVYRYVDMSVQPTGLETAGAATTSLYWDGTLLYAGTDAGHVYSYNGSSWTDIHPSGWLAIESLTGAEGTVFAGTHAGHVLRYLGGTAWAESGQVGTADIESLATYAGPGLWAGSDQGTWRGILTVPPSVTTDPATSITTTGATFNGQITDTGGEDALERGFRFREKGTVTWNTWTEAGTFGTGAFSHPQSGLTPDTDYECQACARNWTGWTYGNTANLKTAALPKPVVNSVSPATGPSGTQVTLTGSNFGPTQGSSTVTVGGVEAQVVSWSDTKIVIVIPGGTQGGAVVVTTGAGGSNADKDFEVVTTDATWYLAEGTTAWGFSTYISITNPNDSAVTARITYMDPSGASGKGKVLPPRTITLAPGSQTTVDPRWDLGDTDFSTKVECLQGKTIAVDRTMFWKGQGCDASQSGYHNSIGATAPSKQWYLPEGSSNWGFETWTLVENPGDSAANVKLTYMTSSGPAPIERVIPPNSRATYSMAGDIGSADASIEVTSDVAVVAERSMYKGNKREGSCSIGATAPANDFFLAEGATGYDVGFNTYLLIQNPQNAPNQGTITFQTQAGQVEGPTFTMLPQSRMTVRLNDHLPENTSVSTMVHGSHPLIAERAMYWDNGTGQAFHTSIGLADAHMGFMLPDGQATSSCETWTLVANPNPGAVTVRVTYLPEDGGQAVSFTDEIAPGTRATYSMADKVPSGRASIMVQSLDGARPVVVERSMYWNGRGGGTDTIGAVSDV